MIDAEDLIRDMMNNLIYTIKEIEGPGLCMVEERLLVTRAALYLGIPDPLDHNPLWAEKRARYARRVRLENL